MKQDKSLVDQDQEERMKRRKSKSPYSLFFPLRSPQKLHLDLGEIDNFNYIQMQIEERKKMLKKRFGKQKVKVKIEDDYQSHKKIQNR